ncbi:MAG: hypothetical protein NVS4B2_23330 [Chloroflexota bacterium]
MERMWTSEDLSRVRLISRILEQHEMIEDQQALISELHDRLESLESDLCISRDRVERLESSLDAAFMIRGAYAVGHTEEQTQRSQCRRLPRSR